MLYLNLTNFLHFLLYKNKRSDGIILFWWGTSLLLVSNDAQVDGGISVFLDGGQQSGTIGVSDFSWVEVVLWIQQLKVHTHTSEFYLPVFIFLMKCKCLDAFPCTNLISCWHDGHHRELVHADLGHSHRSQQADLWRTHVCSFSQHTLPAPDVMSYWSIHTHTPIIKSNFWDIIIYIVDCLGRCVLPDVLSGPGLHHDPHLQLLCALQQPGQLTAW